MHVRSCCFWFSFWVLSQEIFCEERLRSDLFHVGWDVKPQLNESKKYNSDWVWCALENGLQWNLLLVKCGRKSAGNGEQPTTLPSGVWGVDEAWMRTGHWWGHCCELRSLLSSHPDRQGVDISVTVCLCFLFVCLFVWLRISPPRIKLAASNFERRFIGIQCRESPVFVNFAPPAAQNRPARGPRTPLQRAK